MIPKDCGDAFNVELGEGWTVQVDLIKDSYTVSRDSRSVTINDFTRVPRCEINYGVTMKRGEHQISIPAHVLELINELTACKYLITDPWGPNIEEGPIGTLENKLTNRCLRRVGGRVVSTAAKRRVTTRPYKDGVIYRSANPV